MTGPQEYFFTEISRLEQNYLSVFSGYSISLISNLTHHCSDQFMETYHRNIKTKIFLFVINAHYCLLTRKVLMRILSMCITKRNMSKRSIQKEVMSVQTVEKLFQVVKTILNTLKQNIRKIHPTSVRIAIVVMEHFGN